MKPLAECRLYTFIDTACLRGREPGWLAQQLCDGGSDVVQLRAKTSAIDEIRRMTESVLPITERAGVSLVINDHPALAREVGAPMCHLGQEDFFNSGHRHVSDLWGESSESKSQTPTIRLGLSTHSPEQALRAMAAEPAYIAIGPVYATATKPGAKPVTLAFVRWAAANVTIPWFAIGGITLQNLGEVLEAGAQRICVVSAILNAPDVAKACQQFKQRLLN